MLDQQIIELWRQRNYLELERLAESRRVEFVLMLWINTKGWLKNLLYLVEAKLRLGRFAVDEFIEMFKQEDRWLFIGEHLNLYCIQR
jgi:hypothetical protein